MNTDIFDMTTNLPPQVPDIFEPVYTRAMQSILNRGNLTARFGTHAFHGTEDDRVAGACFVSRRLETVPEPGRMVITNSTQAALLATITRIVGVGGTLAVDQATYPVIGQFASLFQFHLIPLPIDREGTDPDAFSRACERHTPDALYATPTLQNPTTGVMGLKRRRAITETARRHGVTIIEDDIYSLLPVNQPPPLAALAPEITWYILGTTKGIAAGLKTCYVVTPSKKAAEQTFWPGVRATYWMCAPANAGLVTELIKEDRIDRIISAVRTETRNRQDRVARALSGITFRAHQEGLHVWVPLPPDIPGPMFVAELQKLGIKVAPGELYAVGNATPLNGIRFGTGKPETADDLDVRVQQIRAVFSRLVNPIRVHRSGGRQ